MSRSQGRGAPYGTVSRCCYSLSLAPLRAVILPVAPYMLLGSTAVQQTFGATICASRHMVVQATGPGHSLTFAALPCIGCAW
eukprot:56524-Eustigmatos_ZCMA.PRE.1